jgi:hypothetical protein
MQHFAYTILMKNQCPQHLHIKKTAVLHSSGTAVSRKMTISQKNHDIINAFNSSPTSFYWKGYYYHSQMFQMNAGP